MAKYFTPIAYKAPATAQTFNNPLGQLDDQIDANAQQIAAAEGNIETIQGAVQGINSEISGIKSKQAADEADITALDAAVAGLDDDLTDVATDVSQLKTDMTDVQGRMQTAEGNISALQTATGGLQTDVDGLETDLGVVEGTVEGLQTDIEGLDSRMATAEGDIDTLEATAEDLDERVTDLEQAPGYELPTASQQTLGGVKIGSNLSIDQDGVLSATDTTYSPATSQADGLMSAQDKGKLDGVEAGANAYTLPAASSQDLGGVKVGSGLSIDANGVLSASGGGGSSAPYYFVRCSTASATAEKALSIPGVTEYTEGMIIDVLYSSGNTATSNVKINVNSLGAKSTQGQTKRNSSTNFLQRYIYYGGSFYASNAATAYRAEMLDTSRNIDGVGFNASTAITHTIKCTTAAAETKKVLQQMTYQNLQSTGMTGYFIRVELQYGNTAYNMQITYASAATSQYIFDLYNADGLRKMPRIAAGGWMEIIYNQTLARFILVNWSRTDNISATSDTDTVLDDLTDNKDFIVDIAGVKSRLTNVHTWNDLHEQYLYSRPATITPGSAATPVVKYRCRQYDSTNSVWLGWTEWTAI
jgi:archaellum component FlaC